MENPDETVNGLLMKQRMEWVKLCNQLECENKKLKFKQSENKYVVIDYYTVFKVLNIP